MSLPDLPLMTRRRALAFSALLGAGSAWPLQAASQLLPPPDAQDGNSFRVLAFHDIRDNVRADFEAGVDGTAINESTLVDFFAWLVQHRYNVVSLQQVIAARTGGAPLPPRAVLLSFDDGYLSTYTRVFPLLRQHGFSAVLALVSSWMEVPSGARVPYGTQMLPREQFLSWDQAAEMARSGLVELASHSHALHEGIQGNPQGNLLAAATTLRFDPASQRYEDVDTHVRRVEADLRRSRELIEARTGARVRAMVWPYGAYHSAAIAAAGRAGMPVTLTLDDGPNTPAQTLSAIRRALPSYRLSAPEFQWLLRQPAQGEPRPINRIMHVDLDYVYDPDPAQQELNLSLLIERVAAVAPRAVFLQAFADPDGDGVAEALYFPNRHLPVRADLFSRAAWQIYTRAGARVYAWMPVMSLRLPEGHPLARRVVQAQDPSLAAGRYHRLSPFDEEVRTLIGDIYEDLGRHARFQGLLFHDDAFLGDDEDTSPAALQTYARWQLPADVARIRSEPALMQRWTAAKTRHLTEFTHALAQRTRAWQPVLETARNYYARTVMEPQSQAWFAQDYAAALDAYDYVALMAMPYMEEAADAKAWLAQLAQRVAATPGGAQRTVFELQARDWRSKRPLADAELAGQWELLLRHGMRHLGYYPDDFHNNQPSQALLQRTLSVRSELARPQVWARDPAAQGAR